MAGRNRAFPWGGVVDLRHGQDVGDRQRGIAEDRQQRLPPLISGNVGGGVRSGRPVSDGVPRSLFDRTRYLIASHGNISPEFLARAGVPSWLAHMAPFFRPEPKLSTMQTAAALLIETKLALGPPVGRVFVSYSHGDAKFVDQLVHKFKRAGITYFRDKDHLVAGKMERQIAREIAERDAFVLALSERSLKATGAGTKSNSQENGKSRDQIDYLFPITLDDAWFNTEKYDAGVQKAVADHQVEISFLKKNFLLLSMDGRKFKESFERLLDGLRNNREGKYISPY